MKTRIILRYNRTIKFDIDSSIKNIRQLSHSILPSKLEEDGLAAAL